MSRQPSAEERIRVVARQHPGWTPSQVAIFLQGENVKVTSEDVRRALARPSDLDGTPVPAQYLAPAEARSGSALGVGVLFGILIVLASTRALWLLASRSQSLATLASAVATVLLLLIAGAAASRRRASGAAAGAVAMLVALILQAALAFGLYHFARSTYTAALGPQLAGQIAPYGPALAVPALVALVVGVIVGLMFGWVGGRLFGRRRRRATFG